MVKEIERTGMPIVQMCNLIPVAKTVGANRIVPTISIPYPLGDPATSKEDQWKLRYHRVKVAVEALATPIEEPTVFDVSKINILKRSHPCPYGINGGGFFILKK